MTTMRPRFTPEPNAVTQLTPEEAEGLSDSIVDRFGPDAAPRPDEPIDEYVLRAQARKWLYVNQPRSALSAVEKFTQHAESERARARGAVIYDNLDAAAEARDANGGLDPRWKNLSPAERYTTALQEKIPRATVVPPTEDE
jgi:hypothetical protein